MKNAIIICCLLIPILSTSTKGQISADISLGINYSTYQFKNLQEIRTEPMLGYFLGIGPNFQLSERIQLSTDFQYSLKGYQIDNPISAAKFRLAYLEIIPELEYNVLDYLSFSIGMSYGIKILEQFKVGNSPWMNADQTATVRSEDLGITWKVQFSHNNYNAFIRTTIGIIDVANVTFTDINGQVNDQAKQLSRNVQIGFIYSI